MPGSDRSRPGEGGSEVQAATKQLDTPSLTAEAAWWRDAKAALRTLASTGQEFTADDLTAIVGHPARGRTMSALFSIASRRKEITACGATISRTGLSRIWRGAR